MRASQRLYLYKVILQRKKIWNSYMYNAIIILIRNIQQNYIKKKKLEAHETHHN